MFLEWLFVRHAEQYNHLNYISFKIVPLCNYTVLPAALKMLETCLAAMLRKPFQLLHRILKDVTSITKAPSLQFWFRSSEQVKTSWRKVRRLWGMFQCCHIAKESLTKTDRCAGALSWRGNQLMVLHFWGRFLPTAYLKRQRMPMYFYLFTVFLLQQSCKLYQRIPGTFWSCYV